MMKNSETKIWTKPTSLRTNCKQQHRKILAAGCFNSNFNKKSHSIRPPTERRLLLKRRLPCVGKICCRDETSKKRSCLQCILSTHFLGSFIRLNSSSLFFIPQFSLSLKMIFYENSLYLFLLMLFFSLTVKEFFLCVLYHFDIYDDRLPSTVS